MIPEFGMRDKTSEESASTGEVAFKEIKTNTGSVTFPEMGTNTTAGGWNT